MTDGIDLPSRMMLLPALLFASAFVSAIIVRGTGPARSRLPSWLMIAGAIAGVLVAVNALLRGGTEGVGGWSVAPFVRIDFRVDPLAAFFLLVISLPAIAAAWYGVGYLESSRGDGHPTSRPAIDALLAAFLASMSLLVLTDGVFGFLLFWELMSLVSFFLVLGDGHHAATRRAAYVYVVMTHVGTGFLLLAFMTLARHAGSFEFEAIHAAASGLGRWERDLVFLLALVGFGTKAGLIPLHVWLPRAHPAAPSHVSALMSGVMVKMAVFGLLRVAFEWAAPGPVWWGAVLIVAGAVSAVLGILYALMERDLKRVLAYSTVEHIGIITLGLGSAVMLSAGGHAAGAALALIATLVHLLNHAIFKSLLFLVAGAVQIGTGTRDLERLGGLVRRMPRTAALFLVGAVAIAALPPLNGFTGEWLLFQGLLRLAVEDGSAGVGTLAAVAAGALALTGALAVACFVRAFGVGFLALPRSQEASEAREVGSSMIGAMGLLAACCVVLGVTPGILFRLLRHVTTQLTGAMASPSLGPGNVFESNRMQGTYAPLAVVIGLVVVGVIPWLVARWLGGPGRTRVAPTWVCGSTIEPRMEYSATAFAKPIRLIFQAVIRPVRNVTLDRPSSPYFVRTVRYQEHVKPIFERHLYERVVATLFAASHHVRTLQSGSMRAYLTYLFVTLVVVIVLAR
ncbi:MAG: hydrogenase-4 component [Thermomicrobiales bacterium]|nr:hydrogenase-4 component [Thermomicrobiales bacterium]